MNTDSEVAEAPRVVVREIDHSRRKDY